MRRRARSAQTRPSARIIPGAQVAAGWLTLIGAVGLFLSLFMTWSHQLPPSVLAVAGNSPALRGVPRDPTGWQVYSIADVLLALLALALLVVALAGRSRGARIGVLLAGALAIVFIVHALSAPPTNGVLLLDPVASSPRYLSSAARSGAGEVVALLSLALAGAGLMLSLATD